MSRRRATLAARRLLQKVGIPDKPPIDVYFIAAELRIEVVERSLGGTSALLLRKDERAICVLHQADSPLRKRFSVAHEIGHFILHPSREAYDLQVIARDERSSEGKYLEEIEANSFAAELLMPSELLRDEVRTHIDLFADDESEIKNLAQTFGVSFQAMTHRLTNLGLLPSI